MINLRLALRSLFKTPVVAGVAVLSLALGIGATAAIFSIFERVILRPLPVPSPHELVNLRAPGPKGGARSSTLAGGVDSIFSYPMFRDLQKAESAFEGIAAHRSFAANLAFGGQTSSQSGLLVSGNYFEVLGLQPAAGRLFAPADDLSPGAHPLAVLSYTFWQQRFAADPGVIGESLMVNGKPMTIIGVSPEGFVSTILGRAPRIFVPISMRADMVPGWEGFEDRLSYWVYLFGRMQPGVSMEQAAASINVPFHSLIQDVELPLQQGLSEQDQERFGATQIVLDPGHQGQSQVQGRVQTPILMLLGVTGFVLLIAAANLANLLLVRATDRATEIAIRLSVGARRHQVVSQLLTESLVLSALGGVFGWLVALATLEFLSTFEATSTLGFDLELGPAVWVILALLTVLTSLAGLFPALHSTRRSFVASLRGVSGQTSGSRTAVRFRTSMATLQIALSMALLVSAGLFTKSLLNVSRVDLGIDVERLATFTVSPELNGYTPEQSRNLFADIERQVGALPGVVGVAASQVPLVGGDNWSTNVTVQGFDHGPNSDDRANYAEIGPDYFKTVGVPLLAGRELEARDDLGAPNVAIVNETFVRKFDLGRDAVGKRMQMGSGGELDIEIVGLVADAAYSEVKDEPRPLFYMPYRQNEGIGSVYFYVRTANPPEHVLDSLRGVVSGLDANLPVDHLHTMEVQVQGSVALDRMLSTLSAAFAVLATLLASIGLYGVLAYSVVQRRREIGLRMALGADSAKVRSLVLRQVGLMTLVGATVGLAGAVGLGRVAKALLYGLESHDPAVLVGATLILVTVAVLSGLVPAQRAAKIDPMKALRQD